MKLIASIIGKLAYCIAFFNFIAYNKQPDAFTVLTILLLALIAFENDKKKE